MGEKDNRASVEPYKDFSGGEEKWPQTRAFGDDQNKYKLRIKRD